MHAEQAGEAVFWVSGAGSGVENEGEGGPRWLRQKLIKTLHKGSKNNNNNNVERQAERQKETLTGGRTTIVMMMMMATMLMMMMRMPLTQKQQTTVDKDLICYPDYVGAFQ